MPHWRLVIGWCANRLLYVVVLSPSAITSHHITSHTYARARGRTHAADATQPAAAAPSANASATTIAARTTLAARNLEPQGSVRRVRVAAVQGTQGAGRSRRRTGGSESRDRQRPALAELGGDGGCRTGNVDDNRGSLHFSIGAAAAATMGAQTEGPCCDVWIRARVRSVVRSFVWSVGSLALALALAAPPAL